MTEWNAADPDATSVYYDLSSWTHDQRAEVAAELAEAGVPHAWDGDELVVPEDTESQVDEMFEVLEARLGIDDAGAAGSHAPRDDGVTLPPPEPFDSSAPTTEYDLADWSSLERSAIGNALLLAHVPHEWDGGVLSVPTELEEQVDELLDEIERLAATRTDHAQSSAPPPYEFVSTLFLASTRLQRDALDETGLDQLHTVLDQSDPDQPPPGVLPQVWRRAWELGQSISDDVAAADDLDVDAVSAQATQLRELLAPLV